jgi:hypothetical protein
MVSESPSGPPCRYVPDPRVHTTQVEVIDSDRDAADARQRSVAVFELDPMVV